MTVAKNFQRLKDRIAGGGGLRTLQTASGGCAEQSATDSNRAGFESGDADGGCSAIGFRISCVNGTAVNSCETLGFLFETRSSFMVRVEMERPFLASADLKCDRLPGCAVAHGAMIDSHLGVRSGNIED